MSEDLCPAIALVSDTIYPYFYGGKELARRLVDRAAVHVYTMKWWDGPRVRTEGPIIYHAISRLRLLYAGNRWSFREAIFFSIARLRLLRCPFDALDADHMPYFQNFLNFVLRLVAWLRRKCLSVTWHEVWGKSYWREYLGWTGYAAWFIERMAMRLPDHIVAASRHTAVRLLKVVGRCSSVTSAPNGVDFDIIRNTYPDAARTDLVAMGRLIEHKRIGVLLEAVALPQAEGMPVTYRVVGDGQQRAALHYQARALGIDHAIDFRHEVSEQKDVYALRNAASVAVFSSVREDCGVAALEAIACGVPVITTSSPDNFAQHLGMRSAVGVVCDPSAAATAGAVKRMLAASGAQLDGGLQRDQACLAEHSWDAVAEQVEGMLQI